MTGTNAVLIVVPIVMLPALMLWLGLVMYAGSHPEWKAHRLAREAAARPAAAAGERVAVPARKQAPGSQAGGQTPVSPRAA